MAAPHPKRANRSHVVDYHLRLLGLVSSDLIIEEGSGVKSVARTGTGAYTITFQHDPGLFVNWNTGLGAVTLADLKGYTICRGVHVPATSTASATLAFAVFNSSFAAADLIAAQYIDLTLSYSEHGF